MNKKRLKKIGIWFSLYILIPIFITFVLIKTKSLILFWVYVAVIGVSAIIARAFTIDKNSNKVLKIIKYIAFICTIALFFIGFSYKFLID